MPSEPYERAVWAPAIDDALLTVVYNMVLASGGDGAGWIISPRYRILAQRFAELYPSAERSACPRTGDPRFRLSDLDCVRFSTVEYDDMPHQDVLVRCW